MPIKERVDVKLKNIKMFQGHEGTGMNADIFINGLKCMHVYDAADGGDYEFTSYEYHNKKEQQIKHNIQSLNDYIATLPDVQLFSDVTDFHVKMDLEHFINQLLLDIEKEKTLRNLLKKEIDHVIYGLPNGDKYYLQKFRIPLSEIPLGSMIAELNKIKVNEFKKGYVFFNTNFKKLGIDVDKLI